MPLCIQWIENENLAQAFLNRYEKHQGCCILHSPTDLIDPEKIMQLFAFENVPLKQKPLIIAGSRNLTPGARTVVTRADEDEFKEVVAAMPRPYLQVF